MEFKHLARYNLNILWSRNFKSITLRPYFKNWWEVREQLRVRNERYEDKETIFIVINSVIGGFSRVDLVWVTASTVRLQVSDYN